MLMSYIKFHMNCIKFITDDLCFFALNEMTSF